MLRGLSIFTANLPEPFISPVFGGVTLRSVPSCLRLSEICQRFFHLVGFVHCTGSLFSLVLLTHDILLTVIEKKPTSSRLRIIILTHLFSFSTPGFTPYSDQRTEFKILQVFPSSVSSSLVMELEAPDQWYVSHPASYFLPVFVVFGGFVVFLGTFLAAWEVLAAWRIALAATLVIFSPISA